MERHILSQNQNLKFVLIFLALFLSSSSASIKFAFSHFFGASKNVNGYQIIFAPFPSIPLAGDNSTLINLSVLDKYNKNVFNIFASLVIKEKSTGTIVKYFPYKFYEFSDISFPYTFQNIGDYTITLLLKVNGDPVYGETPLKVDFDLSAGNPRHIIPFDELILYYVIPALFVISAIAVYLKKKNKL